MAIFDLTLVSTLAAAAAAIAAAISAYLSFSANRLSQAAAKEQMAALAISQYLDFNLRYPEHSTSKKWERYSNYVFAVLMMARSVLIAYPSDKNWRDLLKEHLSYHKEELIQWKDEVHMFGRDVAGLVNDVLSEKSSA
jgi:hypothetical protein